MKLQHKTQINAYLHAYTRAYFVSFFCILAHAPLFLHKSACFVAIGRLLFQSVSQFAIRSRTTLLYSKYKTDLLALINESALLWFQWKSFDIRWAAYWRHSFCEKAFVIELIYLQAKHVFDAENRRLDDTIGRWNRAEKIRCKNKKKKNKKRERKQSKIGWSLVCMRHLN